MPALGLRVSFVLDLDPAVPVVLVDAQLSLGDDSLKVLGADLLEEALAVMLDVLREQKPLAFCLVEPAAPGDPFSRSVEAASSPRRRARASRRRTEQGGLYG